MNDTASNLDKAEVLRNIDRATVAFNKKLEKLRTAMGDAYDFMRGWAELDPACEPMIKAFTAQFERSDDFRCGGVIDSLRLTVAGDMAAGIRASMQLLSQVKKLRDPEYAPFPVAMPEYKGQNPHVAAAFWATAKDRMQGVSNCASGAQRMLASISTELAQMAADTGKDPGVMTKLMDSFDLWAEQYRTRDWSQGQGVPEYDYALTADRVLRRMEVACETPEAAASWLTSIHTEYMSELTGEAVDLALARANDVRDDADFDAKALSAFNAVAGLCDPVMAKQMARFKGLAQAWAEAYPWLRPLTDAAVASIGAQLQRRWRLMPNAIVLLGPDRDPAYTAANQAQADQVKRDQDNLKDGLHEDYFKVSGLADQKLEDKQRKIAVSCYVAMVAEAEMLGCLMMECSACMVAAVTAFMGLVKGKRVSGDCVAMAHARICEVMAAMATCACACAPVPPAPHEVDMVANSIDNAASQGFKGTWGDAASTAVMAVYVHTSVDPETLMRGFMEAVERGDNPMDSMAKAAMTAVSPMQKWCVHVAETHGDEYDPGRGTPAGLGALMEMMKAAQAK